MDICINDFIYGGKLSSRSISTEEEELSWDISSCQHEYYKGRNSHFKSSGFCFAEAWWVLFATFDTDSISFGIFLLTPVISDEVIEYCCNISYRKLDGEVFKKSFELKFKCEEGRPLMGMKDLFKLKNSVDTQLKNGQDNVVIICRLSAKRSTDISCSRGERSVKIIDSDFFGHYAASFLMKEFIYCGKLTSKFISTEEKELTWDISDWVHERQITRGMSPDFSFAGSTWYLVVKLHNYNTIFGIDVRKRCSSDEVFDCCCDILYQNFKGKVYKRLKLKFKCDKTMPLISGRQDYIYEIPTRNNLKREEGVVIVCRINSKKLTITEECSQTERSIVKARDPSPLPEQKDDGSLRVNPIYTLCQDLRQLLQIGIGSDVILEVGDETFKAHRAILTARSHVFASMFCHNMKEKATGVVNVEDCDASSFPVLLEFLYCGSTEKISEENVFSLYTSSDKYDVRDLKMVCREFLKNNLSVESFCDTVRLSLRHSENELLKLTIDFFARNFKKIVFTVKWQDFIVENPIQANEIFIKALASGTQDD